MMKNILFTFSLSFQSPHNNNQSELNKTPFPFQKWGLNSSMCREVNEDILSHEFNPLSLKITS